MFDFLARACEKPGLYQFYTAEKLWNDPYISRKMLEFHLDGSCELASRNPEFIRRAARFMADEFSLAHGRKVIDFGCGPGLYAQELALRGARVTGIDFSENSIAYARNAAEEQGLDIRYINADYLGLDLDEKFDLVTLIYCDLCALNPGQRVWLLANFKKMLAPGGKVLLDVFSMIAYGQREEETVFEHRLMDGFWAEGDYYGFMNTFEYPDACVYLDKYTIVQPGKFWQAYNWLKYYDLKSLTTEVEAAGFKVEAVYASVAGDRFHGDGGEFAVVLGL